MQPSYCSHCWHTLFFPRPRTDRRNGRPGRNPVSTCAPHRRLGKHLGASTAMQGPTSMMSSRLCCDSMCMRAMRALWAPEPTSETYGPSVLQICGPCGFLHLRLHPRGLLGGAMSAPPDSVTRKGRRCAPPRPALRHRLCRHSELQQSNGAVAH